MMMEKHVGSTKVCMFAFYYICVFVFFAFVCISVFRCLYRCVFVFVGVYPSIYVYACAYYGLCKVYMFTRKGSKHMNTRTWMHVNGRLCKVELILAKGLDRRDQAEGRREREEKRREAEKYERVPRQNESSVRQGKFISISILLVYCISFLDLLMLFVYL